MARKGSWDLRPPAWYSRPPWEHTFGPEVAALCEQIGFGPDPEQAMLLDDIFGIAEFDDEVEPGSKVWLAAAMEQGVIATRQQLKTGLLKMCAIGWMFITCEEVVTWSAHEFSTTRESFRDLEALVTASPILRKRLPAKQPFGFHSGRGDEHMETRDGRTLRFKARTSTGGRGLTGDKMILDEAFAVTEEQIGSITPTLTAVRDPQLLHASSAGMVGSRVLRSIRDRGRVQAPGLGYAEWGAEFRPCADAECEHRPPGHPAHRAGCALDAEDLWQQASPLMGRRRANGTGLTLSKMRNFRKAEPPKEFMRERLGWWEESGAADIFGVGKWEACQARTPDAPTLEALAFSVSTDLRFSTISAASRIGPRTYVRPLAHGPGMAWVPQELADLQRKHRVEIITPEKGPGSSLLDDCAALGVTVATTKTESDPDAWAHLYRLVTEGLLWHEKYPMLELSLAGASVGTRGDREVLTQRDSTSDSSALHSVMWAAWAASRPRKVAPPPPPPVSLPAARGERSVNYHKLRF